MRREGMQEGGNQEEAALEGSNDEGGMEKMGMEENCATSLTYALTMCFPLY